MKSCKNHGIQKQQLGEKTHLVNFLKSKKKVRIKIMIPRRNFGLVENVKDHLSARQVHKYEAIII